MSVIKYIKQSENEFIVADKASLKAAFKMWIGPDATNENRKVQAIATNGPFPCLARFYKTDNHAALMCFELGWFSSILAKIHLWFAKAQ